MSLETMLRLEIARMEDGGNLDVRDPLFVGFIHFLASIRDFGGLDIVRVVEKPYNWKGEYMDWLKMELADEENPTTECCGAPYEDERSICTRCGEWC